VKQSADWTWNETTSQIYNTYSLTTFNIALQTNLQDLVYYTTNDYNLYYYPVIGHITCPQEEPNCTADERQPTYVEVAGPTATSNSYNNGLINWYQPIQEPFELFSYPRTQAQLERSIGEVLSPLSDTVSFSTGNAITGTFSSNWTNEGTQTSSVASSAEIKQATSLTVSAGTQDWTKVAGFGLKASVTGSYSESTSNKSILLETNKLGESSGLTGTLPGTFADPNKYQYSLSPVIYGEPPAPEEAGDSVNGVDISTHGILWGTFLADASNADAGSFWKSSKSPYNQTGRIDIALSHPGRWHFEGRTFSSGGVPPECLAQTPGATLYQCAYESPPDTSDVWGSAFYWMKGLFISADIPGGPQVMQTTVGRTVYLQARVYNYSFQPMQAGWTLHVRFYRQPWNVQYNVPAADAVLLNPGAQEIVKDSNGKPILIPAYGASDPNWVIAQTSFDTSGWGGAHFVFWVVAWAEDQNGKLVPEVEDHGLQSIPGTLRNIADAPMQTVNVTYPSAPEFSGETSFTNNVGFFRQDFYVAPAASPALTATSANQSQASPQLLIQNVKVSPVPGQRTTFRYHR